jgi:hypothetical protein
MIRRNKETQFLYLDYQYLFIGLLARGRAADNSRSLTVQKPKSGLFTRIALIRNRLVSGDLLDEIQFWSRLGRLRLLSCLRCHLKTTDIKSFLLTVVTD